MTTYEVVLHLDLPEPVDPADLQLRIASKLERLYPRGKHPVSVCIMRLPRVTLQVPRDDESGEPSDDPA